MVIAVTGYARSGKDEIGKILVKHGFRREALADEVKKLTFELFEQFNPDSSALFNQLPKEKQRPYFQFVGERLRQLYPYIWLQSLLPELDSGDDIAITDLRYWDIAQELRWEYDTKIIRVNRPGIGPVNNHISDNELDTITPDFVVLNDGSLEDLEEKIKEILKKLGK